MASGITGRDEAAVARFIERYALILTDAGMPRMAARVFTAIFTADDGSRTAAELTEMLRVSPAAISGAVRYLVQTGLVTRVREPGERRDRYAFHGDTWYEAITRRDRILLDMERGLREGIEAVGAGTPAGARLEENRRFLAFVLEELPRMMERWRELRSTSPADQTSQGDRAGRTIRADGTASAGRAERPGEAG